MAQWNKGELQRLICDAIAPVVSGAGFVFRKSSGAFVRKIERGRQELGLSLIDYHPIFEFSFTLATRLEAVQEIVNRFSGSPPNYHGSTLTSITQLEFLGLPAEPGRGVTYRVASGPELTAMLPGIIAMIRERVLPFFEEYRDVAAVNRGLNPDGADEVFQLPQFPDRRAFDATNQPYRAMRGIAVAYMARDPRLPRLIAAYRSQISQLHENDRSKLENLVTYLSDSSPK